MIWLHHDDSRQKLYEIAFADVEHFVFPLWRKLSGYEPEEWAETPSPDLQRLAADQAGKVEVGMKQRLTVTLEIRLEGEPKDRDCRVKVSRWNNLGYNPFNAAGPPGRAQHLG